MSKTPPDPHAPRPGGSGSDFERAAEAAPPGLLAEFWDFLRYNKKWWLLPLILVLLCVGLFILLTGTAAGPFIYTLF